MFGGGAITGSERIIDTSFGDTWTWDGKTWTLRPTTPHPSARYQPAMASFGRTAVLFGGEPRPGQPPLGDTWVWDGARWDERHPAHIPPARASQAMATANGRLVLHGGFDLRFSPMADTWLWDGTDWTPVTTSGSPAVAGFCMAGSAEQILAAGGVGFTRGETWLYEGKWSSVSLDVLPQRSGCAMTALGNRRFLLFGGSGKDFHFLNDTWVYDADPKTWSQISASGPPARNQPAMVTFQDRVVLFGGEAATDGPSVALHDTWAFDGTAWTQVPPSLDDPPGRFGHAMAVIP